MDPDVRRNILRRTHCLPRSGTREKIPSDAGGQHAENKKKGAYFHIHKRSTVVVPQ